MFDVGRIYRRQLSISCPRRLGGVLTVHLIKHSLWAGGASCRHRQSPPPIPPPQVFWSVQVNPGVLNHDVVTTTPEWPRLLAPGQILVSGAEDSYRTVSPPDLPKSHRREVSLCGPFESSERRFSVCVTFSRVRGASMSHAVGTMRRRLC